MKTVWYVKELSSSTGGMGGESGNGFLLGESRANIVDFEGRGREKREGERTRRNSRANSGFPSFGVCIATIKEAGDFTFNTVRNAARSKDAREQGGEVRVEKNVVIW